MTATPAALRRLIVLGSTGSIGVNTLDVVEHLQAQGMPLRIVGLAARRNSQALIEQARRHPDAVLAISEAACAEAIRQALPSATVIAGPDAAEELVERVDATDLLVAVVGSAALGATLAAIRSGVNIALANKETLVAAGELVTPLLKQHHARLIPVDSEHSAIFQCLNGQHARAVKRVVLTASGGPFR